MAQAPTEPKLLLPFLRPFYDRMLPLTWALVRIAVGWNLIVHGWGKVLRGPVAQADGFARDGLPLFGVKFAIFMTVIEFVGGICIALGLFTRSFHQDLVEVVDRELQQSANDLLGYFWHGVGRATYFAPRNFLTASGLVASQAK